MSLYVTDAGSNRKDEYNLVN